MEFPSHSYRLHEQGRPDAGGLLSPEIYQNWFERGTVDVWRHLRMFASVDPLLEEHPGASWLTVGDGTYGTAAMYIARKGGNALPVDLHVSLLEAAKASGLISDFRKENAEALSFADRSFDFAFCKEAFHHFPQPFRALYEMLRVARRAVVLCEPADWLPSPVPRRILRVAKNGIRRILRRPVPHSDTGSFEPAGNYVYNISERELEKAALGLNLPAIAFRRFHDVYFDGVEFEKADEHSALFRKTRRALLKNELLCRLGLGTRGHLAAILWKEPPAPALRARVVRAGFDVVTLPANPYVSAPGR